MTGRTNAKRFFLNYSLISVCQISMLVWTKLFIDSSIVQLGEAKFFLFNGKENDYFCTSCFDWFRLLLANKAPVTWSLKFFGTVQVVRFHQNDPRVYTSWNSEIPSLLLFFLLCMDCQNRNFLTSTLAKSMEISMIN